MPSHTHATISPREYEVIRLAADGYCDKEIAASLGVQISTVHTYWDRIRMKTETRSRTHAVCWVLGLKTKPAS